MAIGSKGVVIIVVANESLGWTARSVAYADEILGTDKGISNWAKATTKARSSAGVV